MWEGHVGKKEFMNIEKFQSLFKEEKNADGDEGELSGSESELTEDAKKWFEEMAKESRQQRSDSVLV